MRGNLSKRGLNGSKGEKGDKGDMQNIEFRINPETGELEYRYNGMLVDREYISSHDIVTKDQVNELKQLVIAFEDKYVGDKTFEEIVKAIDEGKEIVGVMPPITNGKREMLRFTVSGRSDTNITLMTIIPWVQLIITCNKDNIWSSSLVNLVTEDMLSNTVSQKLMVVEKTANKVTHINKDTPTDDKYPSAKAVIQHVATETSTAKGEMEGLAKDYKRECDEKINAQNEVIGKLGNRCDGFSVSIMTNQLGIGQNKSNIGKNTSNITALTERMDDCEKDITKHGEDIKELQGIESRVNELSDDYSAFRNDMNMNMLNTLDALNKTEAEMDKFEATYGSGMEKLESFGDVNSLTTNAKTLVGAINELYALAVAKRSFVLVKGGSVNWTPVYDKDDNGNIIRTRYAQVVNVNNATITPNSKVDLQVTDEQFSIFYEKDVAFHTENDNGVVTVYCVGNIPENDYEFQVVVTEVV